MRIEPSKFLDALIEATETELQPAPKKGVFRRMTDTVDHRFQRLGKMTHKDIIRKAWLRHPISMIFADKDD